MGNEISVSVSAEVITFHESKNTENGSDLFCFSFHIYGRPETANAGAGTTENATALEAFRLLPENDRRKNEETESDIKIKL